MATLQEKLLELLENSLRLVTDITTRTTNLLTQVEKLLDAEKEITSLKRARHKLSEDELRDANSRLEKIKAESKAWQELFDKLSAIYKNSLAGKAELLRIEETYRLANQGSANLNSYNSNTSTKIKNNAFSLTEKDREFILEILNNTVFSVVEAKSKNSQEDSTAGDLNEDEYKEGSTIQSKLKSFIGDTLAPTSSTSTTATKSSGSNSLIDAALNLMPPWVSAIIHVLTAIKGGLDALADKVGESVNEAASILSSESTQKFDSRLYGLMSRIDAQNQTNVNFVDMAQDVIDLVGSKDNLATSSFINEKELIENMTQLVNQGVAYNIELRALWDTMMDKMVSTFEVTNETLLRLILLQLSELTDTYMGVEAAITRTLNGMFKDTLYLNSTYDAVWSSLTDTLSNVSADLGTSIAYLVQLWLGSLSSLGLSSNAATGISSAVNSLLTGNYNGMSNLGLTLLAMAAAKENLSLADILVNGIQSGSDMSTFMKGIIEVLLDIYGLSKDNNVLLSEWGQVFDLSIADWKSIANLTTDAIATLTALSNYNLVLAKLEVEHIEQYLVSERTLAKERLDNAIENLWFEAGWDIASDTKKYATWRTAELVAEVTDSLFGSGPFASVISTITDLTLDFEAVLAAWDPLMKFLRNTSGIFTETEYWQFKNSKSDAISNGVIGDFLGEFFSDVLLGTKYVDYGSIMKLSYSRMNTSAYGFSGNPSYEETKDSFAGGSYVANNEVFERHYGTITSDSAKAEDYFDEEAADSDLEDHYFELYNKTEYVGDISTDGKKMAEELAEHDANKTVKSYANGFFTVEVDEEDVDMSYDANAAAEIAAAQSTAEGWGYGDLTEEEIAAMYAAGGDGFGDYEVMHGALSGNDNSYKYITHGALAGNQKTTSTSVTDNGYTYIEHGALAGNTREDLIAAQEAALEAAKAAIAALDNASAISAIATGAVTGVDNSEINSYTLDDIYKLLLSPDGFPVKIVKVNDDVKFKTNLDPALDNIAIRTEETGATANNIASILREVTFY